jgi:hypothetical protein
MTVATRGNFGRLPALAGISTVFVLAVLFVALVAASCAGTPAAATMTTDASSAEGAALLAKCLAWIQEGNTRVKFGDYTITYGEQARIGQLDYVYAPGGGEPIIGQPCWWAGDTDYFFQDQEGPPIHVSTKMAMAMNSKTYPGASLGVPEIGLIRTIGDPYRLLRLAKVHGPAKALPNSDWSLVAETTFAELVGTDLPPDQAQRIMGDLNGKVSIALEVKPDGTPVSMTWSLGAQSVGGRYSWSKSATPPSLPRAWVDMDKDSQTTAEQEGWRATPADAAKAVDFPVYSLGGSYRGAVLHTIHVEEHLDVLFIYTGPRGQAGSGASTTNTNTPPAHGWSLFEYSESKIPRGDENLVANKHLIKTVGTGDDAYSIYTIGVLPVSKSILIKRGSTYISIEATGNVTGDITEELYAAATALQRVEQ